jgi:hypothetical protein
MYRWKVAHWRSVLVQPKVGKPFYQTPVSADGAGFPDFCLVRERIVFIEAKSGTGRLSAEQKAWRDLLESAGQEYVLVRDNDLDALAVRLR